MTDRLTHRGPDGRGVWKSRAGDWEIALGHRRLSIIDIEGGAQPLGNEDGAVQIIFNGEIYNFRELRAMLEQRGHRFATRCDTEAIIHHYEDHGAAGLDALNGMFAFAIWDQRDQKLLLARDRVGIKPLYYAPLPDGGVAFASELTALMEHPAVDRALDPAGLASYFFGDFAHPPVTLVRGARKLPPGRWIEWSSCQGLGAPRAFWSLKVADVDGDPRELAGTLRRKLADAVAAQMVADVPVGVFLSGGIDSSIIAALAQQHAGARGGSGGSGAVQSFSIAFEDPRFDESRYARLMAKHLRTRHVERTFGEGELLTVLDAALDSLDEPMADPSILPTYLLSKLTAEHVKVVLSGDGGDELWAGYPTYKAHRYAVGYAQVPRLFRGAIVDPLVTRLPVRHGYQGFEWKAKRFALRWDDDPLRRHLRWMSNVDLDDLSLAVASSSTPVQLACANSSGAPSDQINQILALDFSTYLPGSVLTKVDRASMAHGLEVRPPMLHNDLVDYAFSLSSDLKLRRTTTKALLKRAAKGLLPDEIIHRSKKGFAIPLAQWLNGPLAPRLRTVIDQSPLWQTGLLSQDVFRQWQSEHSQHNVDRSRPLWALLVLDHWHRRIAS